MTQPTDTLPHGDTRALLTRLKRDIHPRDLRSGRWYTKLLTAYVAHYASRRQRVDLRSVPIAQRAATARKLSERTARLTALAGLGAAAGVTAAAIVSVDSAGLMVPVVWPLAGVGMLSELLSRSILHLQLACELAELYGMPFRPGGEAELMRLYALALQTEMHEANDDPGRGLVQRVAFREEETGGLGKLIAAGLVGETLLRNAMPFADIAVSSVRNWRLTMTLGRFVQGYATRRVALDAAVEKVVQRSPQTVDVLIEGLWFIFISDGRLTGIETALLARLLHQQPTTDGLTKQFISDETAWLERLRQIDPSLETRTLVLRALEIAALLGHSTSLAELTILRRAANTLGATLTLASTDAQLKPSAAADLHGVPAATTQSSMQRVQALAKRTLSAVTRSLNTWRHRPLQAAAAE